jgi:hypothetical protein
MPPRPTIAYEVSDLEAWKRKVAALGVEVIDSVPLPGHDRFEFRDPFIQRRCAMT